MLENKNNNNQSMVSVTTRVLSRLKGFLSDVLMAFSEHKCPVWAASLAYFSFFSIFPFLMFLVYLGSEVISTGNVRQELRGLLEQAIPIYSDRINQIVDQTVDVRGPIGFVGLVGLIWGGSSIFNVLERALCEIWGVDPRSFWRRRALAIVSLLILGLIFPASFYIGPMVKWFVVLIGVSDSKWINFGLAMAVGVITCYTLFRVFPNREVHWVSAITGAVVGTSLIEAAKYGFTLYLGSAFVNYGAVYGSITWMVALALWVYFVGILFFFGAEVAAAMQRRR